MNLLDGRGLNFNNWVSMTFLGQLVVAIPVAIATGHSIAAVQAQTAVLGWIGLVAMLVVARRLQPFSTATFVVLVIAGGPLWGGLAATFMTDVPGASVALVALAIGLRAFDGDEVRIRPLLVSIAVGLWAFAIREYAAIPSVALVGVAALTLRRRGDRSGVRALVIAVTLAAGAAAVLLVYWRTVPGGKPFQPAFPTSRSLATDVFKGAGMLRLIGLWLTPVVLLVGPCRLVRRAWLTCRDAVVWIGLLVGAWLGATALDAPRVAFAGNYFMAEGMLANSVSAGRRPDLVPATLFGIFITVGSLSALILVVAAVPSAVGHYRWLRGRAPLPEATPTARVVTLAVAMYAVGYLAAGAFGLPLYDRYVIPLVPLIALLCIASPPPCVPMQLHRRVWMSRVAIVALTLLGAFSFLYAADSASFDGTRWRVAEAAVRAGWKPTQVGGNFEWVNWYSYQPGTYARRRKRFCVAVVVAPSRGSGAGVATGIYRPPLEEPVRIVAVRTRRPCRTATPVRSGP